MKILPVSIYTNQNKHILQTKTADNTKYSAANFNGRNYNYANSENYRANFLSNISFEGVSKTKSNFELKTIEGLECPCCGNVMMTPKQQKAFVRDVFGKKGYQLEEALLSAQQFYRPIEAEVVDKIISVTRQKPNLTLSEIVKQEAPKQKKRLEKKQIVVIQKLRNISKGLKKETKKEVISVLDKALEDIKSSDDYKHFRTSDIIEGFKEIEERRGSEGAFKDLNKFVKTMPNSHTSSEAFFVKFARKSENEIASRLVSPMVVTTEHINPKADDGSDSTDNYIPMCGTCNSTRQHTPYSIWLKMHPEMKDGLQNYINVIDGIIKEGKIPNARDYNTYVDDIIRTFARETNGELILKRPDDKPVDLSPQSMKKPLTIEEKRQMWHEEALSLYDKVKELQQIKEELKDDEEYHRIVQHAYLADKLKRILQEKKTKSAALYEQKRNISIAESALKRTLKGKGSEERKEVQEAKAKVEAEKEKYNEAKQKYDRAAENADKLGVEVEKIAKTLTFPDEVQAQITKIEENLAAMKSLSADINSYETNPRNQYAIKNEMRFLASEIEERQKANEAKKHDIDFESPENKETKKEYNKLKTRLQMIDEVNKDDFKRLFKSYNKDPEFILKYARSRVQTDFDNLINNSPAAKCLFEDDSIQELRRESKAKEKEYMYAKDEEIKLQKLRSEYHKLRLQGTEEYQSQKLEKLKAKKALLDKKFGAIDIDDQIAKAEKRANEIMQQYTESF